MRAFAALLGHPEKTVPVVHIAGTNGKGSVAAMTASILRAAGLRVGLYTSPHLVRLGERVQVDGVALSPAELTAYVAELEPLIAQLERDQPGEAPSFFEVMTAMAFLQFARRGCDVAVVEVGLGGRLDATNIVTPVVSAITSIGLDHCEYLGHTLAAVAGEKAGIIKSGVPVVMGCLPAEAETVVRQVAAQRGAPLRSIREDYGEDVTRYPRSALAGDHQRRNAATATLIAETLAGRFGLKRDHIERGLAEVSWPGRWDRRRMADGRLVVFDASHNPEGAAALDPLLAALVAETGRKPVVITGVLGEDRARALMQVLGFYAAEIHLVRPAQARALSLEQLEMLVPPCFYYSGGKLFKTDVATLFPSPRSCRAGSQDDVVVVTGSIYLLGEVLARYETVSISHEGHLQDFG